AAGVAGADGCIGLDQGHLLVIDGHVPVKGADDTIGNGAAQNTHGVAHGDNALTYHQVVTVSHYGRGQALCLDLDNGDIVDGIASHQGCGIFGIITEGDGNGAGTFHHMLVGNDITIGGHDHAGTGAA